MELPLADYRLSWRANDAAVCSVLWQLIFFDAVQTRTSPLAGGVEQVAVARINDGIHLA